MCTRQRGYVGGKKRIHYDAVPWEFLGFRPTTSRGKPQPKAAYFSISVVGRTVGGRASRPTTPTQTYTQTENKTSPLSVVGQDARSPTMCTIFASKYPLS